MPHAYFSRWFSPFFHDAAAATPPLFAFFLLFFSFAMPPLCRAAMRHAIVYVDTMRVFARHEDMLRCCCSHALWSIARHMLCRVYALRRHVCHFTPCHAADTRRHAMLSLRYFDVCFVTRYLCCCAEGARRCRHALRACAEASDAAKV